MTVRDDPPGRRLIGYLIPAAGTVHDHLAETARAFAAARLPGYMLPSALVTLESLPLTAHGKVNRAALPAPDYRAPTESREPSTPYEHLLCQAFAEVLSLSRVGIDDNFFELGGHSLLAMSLVNLLQARGVHLEVRSLFETPTPAGLLNRMSFSSVQDALEVLLPIRAHGSRQPFFCLHPASGRSWCYMPLARSVPPDFPLYGLQDRGLIDIDEIAASVEEMAADYIEQIRAVQPSGPYHLLGWSSGGIVAHEIAIQLRAHGEQVAALVIMDTYPIEESHQESPPHEAALAELKDQIRRERGYLLGAVSEAELDQVARINLNNGKITREHQFGTFEEMPSSSSQSPGNRRSESPMTWPDGTRMSGGQLTKCTRLSLDEL